MLVIKLVIVLKMLQLFKECFLFWYMNKDTNNMLHVKKMLPAFSHTVKMQNWLVIISNTVIIFREADEVLLFYNYTIPHLLWWVTGQVYLTFDTLLLSFFLKRWLLVNLLEGWWQLQLREEAQLRVGHLDLLKIPWHLSLPALKGHQE